MRFSCAAVWLFSFSSYLSGAAPQSSFISQLIASAETKVKSTPENADAYGELAFALARRARETEDPVYLQRAEAAVATALQLTPGHFEARKSRVLIRLRQGRFSDAEEEGRALNKQTPDDNPLYGYLAEAALGSGKYAEAESLTQRMLDLRQVNGPGLQRAAQVREIIGFPDAAVEFWNSALRLTSTSDIEERAHILTEVAGLCRRRAKFAEASRYVADALVLEPDYPAALVEKARIAIEDKRFDLAIAVLTVKLEQSPGFVARYWLTVALDGAGKTQEATASGLQFEAQAKLASGAPKHRNELLTRYWVAHKRIAEAVAILKDSAVSGLDFETADAYALALLANGNKEEARKTLEPVIKAGIQCPILFLHAAEIARANGDSAGAKEYWKKCIESNASSPYAEIALRELQNTDAKRI